MLFWWLTIGFAVVWVIAVAIEVIWFWGPVEDEEITSEAASEKTELEPTVPPTPEGKAFRQQTGFGG